MTTHEPWDVQADLLAVAIPADRAPDNALAELDRRVGGDLGAMRLLGEQTGEAYVGTVVRGRQMGADWLLAMGIGDLEAFDRLAALRFGAAVERRLGGRDVRRLAIWLPLSMAGHGDLDERVLGELVARGVVEGAYEPAAIYRHDVKDAPPTLDELILVVPGGDAAAITTAADRGRVIGEGAARARTLAQRASNDVSPEVLADEAVALATAHDLAVDVVGPEQATEMGMGMFMAVGRGSDNPPRMIVIRSGGSRTVDSRGRLLAMVGKGVTFDSGGISIKPASRMEEMKMDKAGACTVISAIATVAQLAPGLPLLAVAPAVENMPGPHSTRPGDIVTAMNGKVVEIENTDAEGRLILGDALTYAERLGATHLVDVATLTGAVERAFGKLVTGGFGTPQEWWHEIEQAGDRQAERYVQIPLIDEYRTSMESWYADFKNSGSADGSLVKSGLFIKEFVTRPWAHLDIGGSGYLREATPWAARGATGMTHATLVELALRGA
ncbi:MAG: leucyl aminopeptidase family protein [Candidatus Limnocylindrales bacterium]